MQSGIASLPLFRPLADGLQLLIQRLAFLGSVTLRLLMLEEGAAGLLVLFRVLADTSAQLPHDQQEPLRLVLHKLVELVLSDLPQDGSVLQCHRRG